MSDLSAWNDPMLYEVFFCISDQRNNTNLRIRWEGITSVISNALFSFSHSIL